MSDLFSFSQTLQRPVAYRILLRSDLGEFPDKATLQEAGRALQQYVANMTAGKVLLMA
jgi:hypothetical protein